MDEQLNQPVFLPVAISSIGLPIWFSKSWLSQSRLNRFFDLNIHLN